MTRSSSLLRHHTRTRTTKCRMGGSAQKRLLGAWAWAGTGAPRRVGRSWGSSVAPSWGLGELGRCLLGELGRCLLGELGGAGLPCFPFRGAGFTSILLFLLSFASVPRPRVESCSMTEASPTTRRRQPKRKVSRRRRRRGGGVTRVRLVVRFVVDAAGKFRGRSGRALKSGGRGEFRALLTVLLRVYTCVLLRIIAFSPKNKA